MVQTEEEKVVIEKKIERLKKKITNLNEAISLQANKIADTMTLLVISRDENVLLERIKKKKDAIEELSSLRRSLLPPRQDVEE
ncbi:MAG: hypothetical protein V2J62_01595 [candidate division KSB1 bacterium]|jgi:hypothetical protein|nr:hypothetical protein [candidate division KSB1 bacterium]